MMKPAMIERNLLVFSIWAVCGFLGLAFLLEGFSRNSYLVSLVGICVIMVGLSAHIVVNAIFGCYFSQGEAAFGVATFGILALIFIAAWADDGLSSADYWSGLTLFLALGACFVIYLSTRYGLRRAFSHFHLKPAGSGNSQK